MMLEQSFEVDGCGHIAPNSKPDFEPVKGLFPDRKELCSNHPQPDPAKSCTGHPVDPFAQPAYQNNLSCIY
jgi:hypothetical protein